MKYFKILLWPFMAVWWLSSVVIFFLMMMPLAVLKEEITEGICDILNVYFDWQSDILDWSFKVRGS